MDSETFGPPATAPTEARPADTASVDVRRRSFLKTATLATAAAAAPALAPIPAEAMRARPDQRAPRYRETDHVRKYYDTNRR